MADLYQIQLPSGSVYDLRDSRVDSLNNWSYVVSTDAATTPQGVQWDDEGTTITGTLAASADTMYKIYLVPSENGDDDVFDEYVTVNPSGSTYQWEMFGNTKLPDMSQYVSKAEAGDLAYKDTASGDIAIPATFTTTATSTEKTVTVTGTTTGSVTETKGTVTVSEAASGTATYTPAGTNADSAVTGSCAVTAAGTIGTGSGTANYTPAGTMTDPTISVATAGSTDTITGITDVGSMPTYTVDGTKLVITAGAAPTADTQKTFKTSDASYTASGTAFAGTGVELTFTGSSATGTITGTAAAQTFTGTGARLESDAQVLTGADFVGASMTSTGTLATADSYSTTVATTSTETVTVS